MVVFCAKPVKARSKWGYFNGLSRPDPLIQKKVPQKFEWIEISSPFRGEGFYDFEAKNGLCLRRDSV